MKPQAVFNEGLHHIWYQREVQSALEYVRSKVTPDEMGAAFKRRKLLGLSTDPSALREAAAIARVTNSGGRDRVAENFHNAIRAEINKRFNFNLPAAAHPQLKGAVNQLLRDRDGLQGMPISNHALVPRAAVTLGKWGEMRLEQVLKGRGTKPSKVFKTRLGARKIDRLFDRIAHEAKAGINAKLDNKMREQILKDAELIEAGKIDDAHWHFFQGAHPDTLKFLEQNGIGYTVY